MSTTQFLNSRFKSWKTGGIVNASGTLEFFEIGGTFSVYATSYSDSGLITPNSNTITLDAEGEADVWVGTMVDVRIRDSLGVTVDTLLNWNPTTVLTQYISTETTLVASDSGKIIRTIATVVLPTASGLLQGWNVSIKNISASSITLSRNFAADTINGSAANSTLFANHSVWIVVNKDLNGFDVFFSPFIEIGTGTTEQILQQGSDGPEWVTVNLRSVGNKLYLYNNYT